MRFGICIAAYSAWVFQGQGLRQVKTGPTTARRDEPARGCLRLSQQDGRISILDIQIFYSTCNRAKCERNNSCFSEFWDELKRINLFYK